MKKILSYLAITLLATSCAKESSEYTPIGNTQITHNSRATRSASTNPYEVIGEQHNQGLDHYLQNGDLSDIPNQYAPVMLDFGTTQLGYNREEMVSTLHDPLMQSLLASNAPQETFRDFLISSNQTKKLAYFDKIATVLTSAPTGDAAVSGLREIEQAVLSDASLDPETQASLLKGLAVGRHSAEYWYTQAQLGEASPWNKAAPASSVDGVAAKFDWGHWGIVALCDAIGACGGGWIGAVGCSLLAL